MIDVGHDIITAVLDEESADRLCRYLKGCRVSFGKHDIEHKEMHGTYKQMMMNNIKRSEIVKAIASRYSISERQVRRLVVKWNKK